VGLAIGSVAQVLVTHERRSVSATPANTSLLTVVLGDICTASIPTLSPPHTLDTPFDLLLRLDSWNGPGISEVDFRHLFVRCRCGMYMTRRVFGSHICVKFSAPAVEVIDLTGE
jgi:hypothetical protein